MADMKKVYDDLIIIHLYEKKPERWTTPIKIKIAI